MGLDVEIKQLNANSKNKKLNTNFVGPDVATKSKAGNLGPLISHTKDHEKCSNLTLEMFRTSMISIHPIKVPDLDST